MCSDDLLWACHSQGSFWSSAPARADPQPALQEEWYWRHREDNCMEQHELLLHRLSFGAAAAAYAEHRPDYAQAAVRWALELAPGPRVLDLGAGTGKLTATLVALGTEVIAVEPDPAMLAELRRELPAVPALPGNAEAIPLPDASVDAVLAGNALHWFDMDIAGSEIARVLVPGGILAGLWNLSGSAGARPLARVTRSAVGAPRQQTPTFQAVAWSPGSARRSRPSSHMVTAAPLTPSWRPSRRARDCWSCQNRNKRRHSDGSALSSRADRKPPAASSLSRC
jgi:SAM-dependent methyltransferase